MVTMATRTMRLRGNPKQQRILLRLQAMGPTKVALVHIRRSSTMALLSTAEIPLFGLMAVYFIALRFASHPSLGSNVWL